MKPEEVFGVNAGKVWKTLKENGKPLTARDISKASGLKITEVFGALGWLGREGKIEIIKERKKMLFKLLE
ncbi:MAG: hypothetical protein B6U94_03545 [Thermofilum sp. ex4484_79]|nr:MAG: hypothetical protein B6U94_03545 [Thermofilum sp. ex4484_79]